MVVDELDVAHQDDVYTELQPQATRYPALGMTIISHNKPYVSHTFPVDGLEVNEMSWDQQFVAQSRSLALPGNPDPG